MKLPLRIQWTPLAETHAAELHRYIAADNLPAANHQLNIVLESIYGLRLFPEKGRIGRVHSTRELVIPGTPYIGAYRIVTSEVQILAVLHGARRWPASFPRR